MVSIFSCDCEPPKQFQLDHPILCTSTSTKSPAAPAWRCEFACLSERERASERERVCVCVSGKPELVEPHELCSVRLCEVANLPFRNLVPAVVQTGGTL